MQPFNLEAFKEGQKALTRDGRVVTFVAICNDCSEQYKLIVRIQGCSMTDSFYLGGMLRSDAESKYDLVSMVSRHQSLIDSYDPEDTWQWSDDGGKTWSTRAGKPDWYEDWEWRLHPHNDVIKAQRNGAIVEKWVEAYHPCWFTCYGEPDWDERATYRVMPEEEKTAAFMRGYAKTLKTLSKRPRCKTKTTTKTVYEWMWKNAEGYWLMADILSTEEEAANYYSTYEHKKTGRSWEVEE